MDNIIEPNASFDFSKLTLAHPVGIQGGAYFTKIEFNQKPLYIQTSKSLTRQGFVKSGKKYYCDLMFDKNSETIIHWLENLEEKCHKLIYEKKDAWFQGNLEETDIETAFNPLIRVYKSGKYYLLRTNVKNTKDDIPAVKIYNEKEITLGIADVTPETEIISILDIQGIKFTSRNFQIDIELKQVMILDNEPIFESCLIKTNKKSDKALEVLVQEAPINEMPLSDATFGLSNATLGLRNATLGLSDATSTSSLNQDLNNEDIKTEESVEESNNLNSLDSLEEIEVLDILQTNESNKSKNTEENISIDFEDLMEDIEENNDDELKEVDNIDFNLDKTNSSITLKKPNQVYFELYKEARNKAKQAKKSAILAYLEAKNIKKTYMIENINDSDSDFDAEIDDVSESELEGL
jgi:hypothetical protein